MKKQPIIIHYTRDQIALMVKFSSLDNPNPRIKRETGESLKTLRAVAARRRVPPPSVIAYFDLEQVGKDDFIWRI